MLLEPLDLRPRFLAGCERVSFSGSVAGAWRALDTDMSPQRESGAYSWTTDQSRRDACKGRENQLKSIALDLLA